MCLSASDVDIDEVFRYYEYVKFSWKRFKLMARKSQILEDRALFRTILSLETSSIME